MVKIKKTKITTGTIMVMDTKTTYPRAITTKIDLNQNYELAEGTQINNFTVSTVFAPKAVISVVVKANSGDMIEKYHTTAVWKNESMSNFMDMACDLHEAVCNKIAQDFST